jgi:hypothetical protein
MLHSYRSPSRRVSDSGARVRATFGDEEATQYEENGLSGPGGSPPERNGGEVKDSAAHPGS